MQYILAHEDGRTPKYKYTTTHCIESDRFLPVMESTHDLKLHVYCQTDQDRSEHDVSAQAPPITARLPVRNRQLQEKK